MKKFSVLYLVVLGAANLLSLGFLTGCSSGSTNATPAPTPTATISIAASGPVYVQIGVESPSTYIATATVTGSTNTAVTWQTSDANLATVDSATGVITPSATNTGTVTITAKASADTSKTATVSVKVVNWVLVESQTYGLQLVDVTSGNPTTLMANNQPCVDSAWSYDHLRIVCFDFDSPGPTVINVYKTDGTAAGTTLVNSLDLAKLGGIGQVDTPSFSPDGKQILFIARISTATGLAQDIDIVDPSGKSAPVVLYEEKQFLGSGVGITRPRFTPDGKQILFEEITSLTVWIMNADGTNPHQLVNVPSAWAMYSPDMSTLYYVWYSYASVGGGWYVYVQDVATGNVKTIAGYDILDVSPNGASILLTNYTNVYTADASGANISPTPLALGSLGSW